MQDFLIVGVDVSQDTLDIHFKPSGNSLRIENETAGFKRLLSALRKESTSHPRLMVVMEHTGHYSHRLEKFLLANGIDFCKLSALHIKRSAGLIRGKDDKADARRIAEYGWLRRDELQPHVMCTTEVAALKNLMSLRAKLVKDRAGYKTRLKGMLTTGTCTTGDLLFSVQNTVIKELTVHIKVIEQQIKAIIVASPLLKNNYELLCSIKGVGFVIAAYMISCTENFQKFASARKFNCYAGLAPFKHESGTSIKGKSRVSHLANKEAKALLGLAANSAIQYNEELKAYYNRRIKEGKLAWSSKNIVKAKIVARMFAVVKRQTPYQPLPKAA